MIKWFEKNKPFALIITILIIIEIFYFSSLSFGGGGEGKGNPWIPIIYHFSVFFLLSFFILSTIKGDKKLKIKYLIIALTISITYAFLDEVHQLFVPSRNFSIGDILTDITGIFLSAIIYCIYNKRIQKKRIRKLS